MRRRGSISSALKRHRRVAAFVDRADLVDGLIPSISRGPDPGGAQAAGAGRGGDGLETPKQSRRASSRISARPGADLLEEISVEAPRRRVILGIGL